MLCISARRVERCWWAAMAPTALDNQCAGARATERSGRRPRRLRRGPRQSTSSPPPRRRRLVCAQSGERAAPGPLAEPFNRMGARLSRYFTTREREPGCCASWGATRYGPPPPARWRRPPLYTPAATLCRWSVATRFMQRDCMPACVPGDGCADAGRGRMGVHWGGVGAAGRPQAGAAIAGPSRAPQRPAACGALAPNRAGAPSRCLLREQQASQARHRAARLEMPVMAAVSFSPPSPASAEPADGSAARPRLTEAAPPPDWWQPLSLPSPS
jgi:hypothetical protein